MTRYSTAEKQEEQEDQQIWAWAGFELMLFYHNQPVQQ